MTTTQSQPRPARRGPGDLSLLAGLALSPLAFVAGGFAALLALPCAFAAPLRPAGRAFFLGVVACALLSAGGVNPWAAHAREKVLDEMEAALGARPQYVDWSFNLARGEIRFEGLRAEVPLMAGSAQATQLTLEAGPGFLWNPGSPTLRGRGVMLEFDGARARPRELLQRLDAQSDRDVMLDFEMIDVKVKGEALSASLRIDSAHGAAGRDGFEVRIAPSAIELELWKRAHTLAALGGVTLRRRGGHTRMTFDVKAGDGATVMTYLSGTLAQEREAEGLVLTVDWLELEPLWSRYRKIDVQKGSARGKVRIWGGLEDLHLGLDFRVSGYEYFHRMVMALDESRAFRVPEAAIRGELRLVEGAKLVFEDMTLEVPRATLCTDPEMNAAGGGTMTLRGEWPELRGELTATVESGVMRKPVSWSPVSTASIRELQPNIVQVAEQFPGLALDWKVDVQRLDLECAPIGGALTGRIEGTLRKRPDNRNASVRAAGKLALLDGTFAFCAAAGSVAGSIEFNPNAPTFEAGIRGALTGKVGDTLLNAEIAGSLSHPGIVFSGLSEGPEDLGRRIATWSARDMDAAERSRRNEELTRLCGPAAAMASNPFLASRAGKVSFSFRP